MSDDRIRIVALGGASTPGSSTEQALRISIAAAEADGAEVTFFDGQFLARLPHYQSAPLSACPEAQELLDRVRAAEGLLIGSPGWHGSISGLVKNAIDYLQETAQDERVYLDGLPVGLMTTAHGPQAAASTLATLRTIVHALRGWPTPLGAAVNSSGGMFVDGGCRDESVRRQLELVGRQVVRFASLQRLGRGAPVPQPA